MPKNAEKCSQGQAEIRKRLDLRLVGSKAIQLEYTPSYSWRMVLPWWYVAVIQAMFDIGWPSFCIRTRRMPPPNRFGFGHQASGRQGNSMRFPRCIGNIGTPYWDPPNPSQQMSLSETGNIMGLSFQKGTFGCEYPMLDKLRVSHNHLSRWYKSHDIPAKFAQKMVGSAGKISSC